MKYYGRDWLSWIIKGKIFRFESREVRRRKVKQWRLVRRSTTFCGWVGRGQGDEFTKRLLITFECFNCSQLGEDLWYWQKMGILWLYKRLQWWSQPKVGKVNLSCTHPEHSSSVITCNNVQLSPYRQKRYQKRYREEKLYDKQKLFFFSLCGFILNSYFTRKVSVFFHPNWAKSAF